MHVVIRAMIRMRTVVPEDGAPVSENRIVAVEDEFHRQFRASPMKQRP
jgi:hypothetical protein